MGIFTLTSRTIFYFSAICWIPLLLYGFSAWLAYAVMIVTSVVWCLASLTTLAVSPSSSRYVAPPGSLGPF